jgi:iron complex transport system ATP-binding protein
MDMNPSILLRTHNLTAGYHKPAKQVLFENLNLNLQAGMLVCFMGPNGIGKSTLLRTLAGLQMPLGGKVLFADTAHKQAERLVSVVLTNKPSTAYLTAEELIAMGRYPYLNWMVHLSAHDKEVVEQAIAITRVAPLRHRRLYELSDGQLQLVMIARALAQETPIMLLDEPTAHLDLNNRVEIMNLLRNIAHKQGKAILVATHELDLALQTADEIWLAGHQQNILTGIPEDLVLSEAFDDIFKFKGFDLKTGKVKHTPWRNVGVQLTGGGPEYLWTKNALERNGYYLQADAALRVEIKTSPQTAWLVNGQPCYSVQELLHRLSLASQPEK